MPSDPVTKVSLVFGSVHSKFVKPPGRDRGRQEVIRFFFLEVSQGVFPRDTHEISEKDLEEFSRACQRREQVEPGFTGTQAAIDNALRALESRRQRYAAQQPQAGKAVEADITQARMHVPQGEILLPPSSEVA